MQPIRCIRLRIGIAEGKLRTEGLRRSESQMATREKRKSEKRISSLHPTPALVHLGYMPRRKVVHGHAIKAHTAKQQKAPNDCFGCGPGMKPDCG